MKNLTLWDKEYGLMECDGKPIVSSRYVAEIFEKEHKHVLRDIANLLDSTSGLSGDFGQSNFGPSSYKNSQSKTQPEYLLTRDGFVMLAMGYTGKKAMQFKEAYIRRFNQMEQYLAELNHARLEFPELTQAILEVHETPRHYHFSNEMDLINRIVLGMTAKEYKLAHNLGNVSSIRPYLSAEEIKYIALLQKVDIGLVLMVQDYHQRKRTLEWYYLRHEAKNVGGMRVCPVRLKTGGLSL